jgi:23S rRNA (uracil1939-C5)-methyltransferase
VSDTLSIADRIVTLQRHVLSFFQGNRFLLRDLVAHVVGRVEPEGEVVDLYAGVGLFAIAVAIVVGTRVTAVEGDRVAAYDLDANARHSGGAVEAVCQPVEVFAARTRIRPRTLILDPPRTGVSRAALEGAISLGAHHLIYVSCDVATLARDSRHLMEAGYVIRHVDAFDLFPNTPHVETVVVFERT